MSNSLGGETIVITGGAGLIGSTFVEAVAKKGGKAIIADINQDLADATAKKINDEFDSKNVSAYTLDITSKESIETLIKNVKSDHGDITGLVNNAYPRNKNYGRKLEDVQYSDFCENSNLHLGGYFLCSQVFSQYFKTIGSGNIINISSIYGVIPPKFEVYDECENMTMPVEYSVIKSGLIHLTKYMAKYYKGSGIRFNCISPGGVFDHQPESFVSKYNSLCLSKGMLDINDLSGTLTFLLSKDSKYINGQNIIVDDGFSL